MSYIHLQLWGKFYNIWSVQQPLNLSDPDLNSLQKFPAICHHKSEGFICRLAQLSRIIWMCRTKAEMVSPDCECSGPMMVMGWSSSLNKQPLNHLHFNLIDCLLILCSCITKKWVWKLFSLFHIPVSLCIKIRLIYQTEIISDLLNLKTSV